MGNFKLALDAGHGIGTAGKRCMKSLDPNETREWYLNNRVCNHIQTFLSEYEGIEILRVDDQTGTTDVSLADRCTKANNWGADLYASWHHNAGISGGTGGGGVIYGHPTSKSMTDAKLKAIYEAVVSENGLRGNRSCPVLRNNFYVLSNTKMAAFLFEVGFMDSAIDIKHILDNQFAINTARGFVAWLIGYAGLTRKQTVADNTSEQTGTKYTVKKGDTLSSIAKSYGTTYQAIASCNSIGAPYTINIGQVLTIPGDAVEHTVTKGQTLSSIASIYGTTYKKIAELNNIAAPYIINIGQVLRIK